MFAMQGNLSLIQFESEEIRILLFKFSLLLKTRILLNSNESFKKKNSKQAEENIQHKYLFFFACIYKGSSQPSDFWLATTK